MDTLMRASEPGAFAQRSHRGLPKALPQLELRHGEAVWVLARLGFQGTASKSTFYEYIKALRKIGIPFKRGEIGFVRRGRANYSYLHLMELALVLTLRVYYIVPDSVIAKIVRFRSSLHKHYRRAYAERSTALGKPVMVEASGYPSVCMRGVFIDLQIDFSGGKLVKFGPPKLLSPFEALTIFAKRDIASRALLPINLSRLSEKLVSAAMNAPVIRSGPPSRDRNRRRRHQLHRTKLQ
jgi:hypothetical protein